MVSAETIDEIMFRLRQLGIEDVEKNIYEIGFQANLVYDAITSDINQKKIPPQLWRVYIDMVCGNFLYDEYINGNLEDLFGDSPKQQGPITSVILGDMTVDFDGSGTDRDIFLANVGYLKEHPDYRYLFDIFRDFLR